MSSAIGRYVNAVSSSCDIPSWVIVDSSAAVTSESSGLFRSTAASSRPRTSACSRLASIVEVPSPSHMGCEGTTSAAERAATVGRPARPIALTSCARLRTRPSGVREARRSPMSVPPTITIVAGRLSPWARVPVASMTETRSPRNAASDTCRSASTTLEVCTAAPLSRASCNSERTPSSQSAITRRLSSRRSPPL
jgi:hypothetical protein